MTEHTIMMPDNTVWAGPTTTVSPQDINYAIYLVQQAMARGDEKAKQYVFAKLIQQGYTRRYLDLLEDDDDDLYLL